MQYPGNKPTPFLIQARRRMPWCVAFPISSSTLALRADHVRVLGEERCGAVSGLEINSIRLNLSMRTSFVAQ